MENSNRLIEEIVEKWEEDFTFLYGSEDPTRTFKNHDDFLIIKNNTKAHLRSSLEKVRQETLKEVEEIKKEYIKEVLLDFHKNRLEGKGYDFFFKLSTDLYKLNK